MRLTAGARLTRLLAVIPWVAERDGPTLREVSERFDYPVAALTADLQEVVMYVGVYPFSPDTLIEVVVDGGRVWISYADWFSRPLRLAPEQALAMMVAGQSMLDVTGDEEGPLFRGLTKLGAALGAAGAAPVEVSLGSAAEDIMATLRTAVNEHRAVRLQYYVYSRDELTDRTIEPARFFANAGQWYVSGHCRLADAERVFRVDRIRTADVTDETFDAPDSSAPLPPVFAPKATDPRVVLELDETLGWVLDQYPHDAVEALPDGGWQVTMAVSARPWLERLLVQLGPHARIVGGEIDDLAVDEVAERILGRYRHRSADE